LKSSKLHTSFKESLKRENDELCKSAADTFSLPAREEQVVIVFLCLLGVRHEESTPTEIPGPLSRFPLVAGEASTI
jgi:hypothetical protein